MVRPRCQKKSTETLTDIQKAVRYFYLQKLGFGGKTYKRTFGTGTTSGPGLNLTTIEERLMEVHWRLAHVTIEHLDACECIRRYDRTSTFFYVDPPYWGTAGYRIPYVESDYLQLHDALAGIKGRFILSINDVPEIRRLFKDFRIKKVTTKYSANNGKVTPTNRGKLRSELLIHNLK